MPKCVGWRITKLVTHITVTRSGAKNIQEKSGRAQFVNLEKKRL